MNRESQAEGNVTSYFIAFKHCQHQPDYIQSLAFPLITWEKYWINCFLQSLNENMYFFNKKRYRVMRLT